MPLKRYAFTLPVPPSANRWHRNVNGRMVTSAEARAYGQLAAAMAHSQGVRQIRRPATVAVMLVWYRSRKSGDLDKRVGICLDALQGIAYENDSQVVELVASRRDDPSRPRLEVIVTELAA